MKAETMLVFMAVLVAAFVGIVLGYFWGHGDGGKQIVITQNPVSPSPQFVKRLQFN
jgi:hypothetical protein